MTWGGTLWQPVCNNASSRRQSRPLGSIFKYFYVSRRRWESFVFVLGHTPHAHRRNDTFIPKNKGYKARLVYINKMCFWFKHAAADLSLLMIHLPLSQQNLSDKCLRATVPQIKIALLRRARECGITWQWKASPNRLIVTKAQGLAPSNRRGLWNTGLWKRCRAMCCLLSPAGPQFVCQQLNAYLLPLP